MVVKLGGWKSTEAVEGAVSCAQKCLAMGRPWIQIHPQTGLANFLLLSFGFSEVMTESWELFRSEYNTRGGPHEGQGKHKVDKTVAKVDKTVAKSKATPQIKKHIYDQSVI